MLPHTPLHHLLLAELDFPVVATSGNLSDEPICTDEREALTRLQGIADKFLVHNRPIARQVDDSVARVMLDRELVLRRARGYAPLPIHLKHKVAPTLAVGAHLKNTVALSVGADVFVSQHIGDLETAPAFAAFQRVSADLQALYEVRPKIVACDEHPDYLSTKWAREQNTQHATSITPVQHHYAHILSCMAENDLEPPVLGVAWDGTGYGPDGTIWGGEFLQVVPLTFFRIGRLRPFRLPGGDAAAKEPRRAALGLLHEVFGDAVFTMGDLASVGAFSGAELATLKRMLRQGVNSPVTSSAGRLFDAVASIVGLRQKLRHEGQAAMELEWALDGADTEAAYPLRIADCGLRIEDQAHGARESQSSNLKSPMHLDWEPMIWAVLEDVRHGVPVGMISAKFHNALAEGIVAVAMQAGEERVALSGGCFQNRYLTEQTVARLARAGFRPYWHQRIPPNDGGIALGQVLGAARTPAGGK